jgi:hypothetical protein
MCHDTLLLVCQDAEKFASMKMVEVQAKVEKKRV